MIDEASRSHTPAGENHSGDAESLTIDELDIERATRNAEKLSDRHRELLGYVAQGLTSKEMERITKMKATSINNSLSSAARILECRNRWEAAALWQAVMPLRADDPPARAGRQRQANAILADRVLEPARGDDQEKQASLLRVLSRWMLGPPMGGETAPMDWRVVTLQVLWVAFVGLLGVTALIAFVLAFYKTFG